MGTRSLAEGRRRQWQRGLVPQPLLLLLGPGKGPTWVLGFAPALTVREPCVPRLTQYHLPPVPSEFRLKQTLFQAPFRMFFSPSAQEAAPGESWLTRCPLSSASPERKWLPRRAVKTGPLTLSWRGPLSSLSVRCKGTSTACIHRSEFISPSLFLGLDLCTLVHLWQARSPPILALRCSLT